MRVKLQNYSKKECQAKTLNSRLKVYLFTNRDFFFDQGFYFNIYLFKIIDISDSLMNTLKTILTVDKTKIYSKYSAEFF